MLPLTEKDIIEFLKTYPQMEVLPFTNNHLVLEGTFVCRAKYQNYEYLDVSYELRISVPVSFPNELPKYFLIDNKIEQDINLHIQEDNKEICLGVPLSLMIALNNYPSICRYTKNVLIPYLYGLTYKLKHCNFPFEEVEHFGKGLIKEYKKILGLPDVESVKMAFYLLSLKKEDAFFEKCPCGCSNPYLACQYRSKLEKFRYVATPQWFREHIAWFERHVNQNIK